MSRKSASSVRPFVTLPPEIRNWVYEYCTPVNGHARAYEGLSLSCKQVHAELKGAATKVMDRLLDHVKKTWRHEAQLRIDMPNALSSPTEVVVELPLSVYYQDKPDSEVHDFANPYLEPTVASLLQLHLSKLTIAFYEDQSGPSHGSLPSTSACYIAHDLNVLLHGGASLRQAEYAKEYNREHLEHSRPVNTKVLVINWLPDLFGHYWTSTQVRHILGCHVMRAFTKKDVVKRWQLDPQGLVEFVFTTSGEDASPPMDEREPYRRYVNPFYRAAD